MMITLSIFGVLLSCTILLTDRLFVRVQEDLFLKQFYEDVLFMQQETMTKQKRYELVFFESQGEYRIFTEGYTKVLLSRSVPSRWSIKMWTLEDPIEFKFDGQTVHPGKFAFKSPHSTFLITFPFGKARFYVTEQ